MNRRTFLKSMGIAGLAMAIPFKADRVATAPRTGPIWIAAADASPRARAEADFLCNGQNDDLVFRQAVLAAAGSRVVLTEGTFYPRTSLPSCGVIFNGQNKTVYDGRFLRRTA